VSGHQADCEGVVVDQIQDLREQGVTDFDPTEADLAVDLLESF
jgi:hypothetical protein